jgi:DNA-binding transcriptional MerR regulator
MSKRDGFSPGVAARITGVTANVQRVWAQRYPGLVPPTAGPHRRFDLSDLCRLRAARLMADGGIPMERVERSLTGPAVSEMLLALRDYERGLVVPQCFLAIPSDDGPARILSRRASADEVTCSSPRPVTLVDLAAIGWDLGHRLATMHWKRGERAEEVRPWA